MQASRPFEEDTIVAVSTPPGRGGIGIVRLSGPRARSIAEPLCRLRHGLEAGRARFAELLDEAGQVMDQAVVTFFAAPHSATGEDVVEMAAHGSPVLMDWLVRSCLQRGARLAEAGEFTRRAFLGGRLDLTQAEGVHDLIASQTIEQARLAAAQLGGGLARTVAPAKRRLMELIAALEAGVDFAEDDIDLMDSAQVVAIIGDISQPLEALGRTYGYGRVVREGFRMAIVGRPNAGKSSLFNCLLERDRAIVTPQAGTTRDAISETLSIAGIPVEVIDTAGLRGDAEGEAERQGIVRSRTAMAEADLVLVVVDASENGLSTTPETRVHQHTDHVSGAIDQRFGAEDRAALDALAGRAHLVVWNKVDLVSGSESPAGAIRVSALSGQGVEGLREAIVRVVGGDAPVAESAMVTNLRQHEAIAEAVAALEAAGRGAAGALAHEFLLLDLHTALDALDRLTGATSTEDILGLIFAKFCIGK